MKNDTRETGGKIQEIRQTMSIHGHDPREREGRQAIQAENSKRIGTIQRIRGKNPRRAGTGRCRGPSRGQSYRYV